MFIRVIVCSSDVQGKIAPIDTIVYWLYSAQVAANDRMIPPDTERFFAERMQAKKTLTLQAGHASLASQGKEIVGLIELAVASVM
jgi:hypothetical protein